MDWSEIWKNAPAIVSIAKDTVLAGVAISGAIVGWKALTKWREETVGKRRLELAEDTLSAFYQMRETINDARAPMVWAAEMVSEDGVPEDVTKNAAYGPIRRLHQAMDTIRDWRTKRHRFAAVFGSDKTKPWTEIEQVLSSMDAACFSLLSVRHDRELERGDLKDHYDKMRQTLFRGFENDEVAPKIAAAVSDIEAICRPIIQAAVDVRVRS